ncbi:ABC transporter permease [Rubrobacter naiadicus]|uniref:ABC transporter permease n=1 Tax=Rubrobacter naiadicus TaxID=1392641 RepID=UPI003B5B8F42
MLLFIIGAIVRPSFIAPNSVKSVLVVASFVGFVATGQAFVILIGGIDLSVPWVLNASAILLVTSSLGQDDRAIQAVLLCLGLGLLVGLINGLGIVFLSVPAVVMTLGVNGIMQGLTLGLSKGFTCRSCSANSPPVVSSAVGGNLLGIPADLYIWFGIVLLVTFVLGFTSFGRKVYAVGNNTRASYLAGVNVNFVTVALYMLSGLFAAFTGIALVGYSGSPSLGIGDPYLFQSIAAVVIGGVSILGGRGNYLGVVAGSISLVALISVLQIMNIPDYGRSILYGVVVILILLLYGREERET